MATIAQSPIFDFLSWEWLISVFLISPRGCDLVSNEESSTYLSVENFKVEFLDYALSYFIATWFISVLEMTYACYDITLWPNDVTSCLHETLQDIGKWYIKLKGIHRRSRFFRTRWCHIIHDDVITRSVQLQMKPDDVTSGLCEVLEHRHVIHQIQGN